MILDLASDGPGRVTYCSIEPRKKYSFLRERVSIYTRAGCVIDDLEFILRAKYMRRLLIPDETSKAS